VNTILRISMTLVLLTVIESQVVGFTFNKPEPATELEGISSRGDSGGPAFIESGSNLYSAYGFGIQK
jgi:hypothetical protein